MIVNTIISDPITLSLFWVLMPCHYKPANREADIECFMFLIKTSWKSSIWTFYIITIFQTICYHNYRKWVHKSSLWSPLPWRRYIFLQLCFNSLFNVLESWMTLMSKLCRYLNIRFLPVFLNNEVWVNGEFHPSHSLNPWGY